MPLEMLEDSEASILKAVQSESEDALREAVAEAHGAGEGKGIRLGAIRLCFLAAVAWCYTTPQRWE